ncbi:MAG: PspC domain-containing protein [Candidatus Limnocylindria bacterium]
MAARLERSATNKMVAGVCGGIAEYLQVDATWVRLVFALLGLFGGIGFFVYIFLVIVMPVSGRRADAPAERSDDTAAPRAPASPEDAERRRRFAGYALVGFGALFLLNNLGTFRFLDWRYVWPLALVGVGVLLIVWRARG